MLTVLSPLSDHCSRVTYVLLQCLLSQEREEDIRQENVEKVDERLQPSLTCMNSAAVDSPSTLLSADNVTDNVVQTRGFGLAAPAPVLCDGAGGSTRCTPEPTAKIHA